MYDSSKFSKIKISSKGPHFCIGVGTGLGETNISLAPSTRTPVPDIVRDIQRTLPVMLETEPFLLRPC
jgi:hypothetical protein